jgi:predicted MPP superfamily phosphohydrolase
MPLGHHAAKRLRLAARLLAVAAILTLATLVSSCGLLDTCRLEVKGYTCESPDLPLEFDRARVVFVTDIHRGPFYSEERVGRLVNRVNRLEPDLILLGGDYVHHDPKYESSCFQELAHLEAPLGCFAILGNHDYGRLDGDDPGPRGAVDAAAAAGITLLRNQAVWVEKGGQKIRLGGVEDYQVGRPRLEPIIDGTTAGDFVLLLSHNPDYSEQLPADAVDLVLSGHTHGGQVTVFDSWAPYVPSEYGQKYRTGIVENGLTTVIVSNGVGTATMLPIRLFAPAQIVVVTLKVGASASVHP